MQRDSRAFLWDVREAALAIQAFTAGMDAAAYSGNEMAQAAVERQWPGDKLARQTLANVHLHHVAIENVLLALRDGVDALATSGALGEVLQSPVTGYSVVYHLEMILLFAALVAIGPLVRRASKRSSPATADTGRFGLADLPA